MEPHKLRYEYTIRFEDGRMQLVGNEKVTLEQWPGLNARKTLKLREELPAAVARELSEVLQLPQLPTRLTLKLAYVKVDDAAPPSRKELAAYDRLKAADQPIIPSMYADDAGIREDFPQIKSRYDALHTGKRPLQLRDWLDRAALLSHDVRINSYKHKGIGQRIEIELSDTMQVHRFALGEYCGALPIPPFPERPEDQPENAIVVTRHHDGRIERSSRVWQALLSLNTIVRIPGSRLVLLTGPPGSGKELFANAIHAGALVEKRAKFKPFGVQGVSLEALRRALFGWAGPKGEIVSGLIAQSQRGTLFLDEFDKASTETERADFYSSLLRVLEAGTYNPEESIRQRSAKGLSWILAGAFTGAGTVVPRDLWTRLNASLQLESPVTERGYAEALFLYWHFRETMGWLKSGLASLFDSSGKADSNELSVIVANRLLFGERRRRNLDSPLEPGVDIKDFAERFANQVDVALDGNRAIRQAAFAASRALRETVLSNLGAEREADVLSTEGIDRALEAVQRVLDVTRG
ncbi:MAG: sigma 54-interacting transcriptional regulator [Acidobacteria bacterium]|nr:sigma 54-interacting transcriptional regulator [Acidobacteriota bacterium]